MLYQHLLLICIASISNTLAISTGPLVNDYLCRGAKHEVPIIFLHGLGGNGDAGSLQTALASQGYCTFSITYGAFDDYPDIGGLQSVVDSSKFVADFVSFVSFLAGASKIDLIGHSEGALMTLHVPKSYPKARAIIRKVIALAPPSHGTSAEVARKISDAFKGRCPACVDLTAGSDVIKSLESGGIAQSGIQYTIIATKFDETVVPAPTASVVQESGVRNIIVQDVCPLDQVGHNNIGSDLNVGNLILNELQDQQSRKFDCTLGTPGRRGVSGIAARTLTSHRASMAKFQSM